MDFLTQPPFRPDAHLAVERPQLHAHALEVEELIDAPKQVVTGHVIIETKILEQPRRRYLRSDDRIALQQATR